MNNILGFEMNSEYILRKMIKNIISKYWKSIYSFWDPVPYKYQPGTAHYRLLLTQTPILFFIFLFSQSSLSFHKVPQNLGSFPETIHQYLGKSCAINQWWLLHLANSSHRYCLYSLSHYICGQSDSTDLINQRLPVSIIQLGRVLDNSFGYKKKNQLVSPQTLLPVTLLMLWSLWSGKHLMI